MSISGGVSLNNDFMLLNQNYQDYMRDLNSLKAEEMMKTKGFLLFKDKLVDYLRSFVKSLQLNVGSIERILGEISESILDEVFSKIFEHELSIPRLDEIDEALLKERIQGRFQSIKDWFVGDNGKLAEAEMVFDMTNEIIRKITRYAAQISEQSNLGANRREEYYKIASMFKQCADMAEAHQLAAAVFGVEQPIHIKGDFPRIIESINSGVYEEEAFKVLVLPRSRNYREKAKKSAIVDRTMEKEQAKQKMLAKLEAEKRLLESYITDNELDFAALPVIPPEVRDTFLLWLSRALERKEKKAKTDEGRSYIVEAPDNSLRCTIECTDGSFDMPHYKIRFV